MVVLATHLLLDLVLLDHLGLGEREEAGVGRVGHELSGLAERVEWVHGGGQGRIRDRRHGAAGREGVLCRLERGGFLGGKLVEAIGRCTLEGVHRVLRTTAGGEGLAQAGLDGARVVLRAGVVDGGPVGLGGVLGATDLQETGTELGERQGGGGVGPVDGGLAESHAGVGGVARLEQRVAKAEIRLVRSGVARVLRGGLEARLGAHEVARGGVGLALVGKQRAATAVGGVGERLAVGDGGVTEETQAHERVAAQVVSLPRRLAGLLGRGEELGRLGEVPGAIGVASVLEKLGVHVCSLP